MGDLRDDDATIAELVARARKDWRLLTTDEMLDIWDNSNVLEGCNRGFRTFDLLNRLRADRLALIQGNLSGDEVIVRETQRAEAAEQRATALQAERDRLLATKFPTFAHDTPPCILLASEIEKLRGLCESKDYLYWWDMGSMLLTLAASEARVRELDAKVAEQAHEISKMTANAWMPNDSVIKAENAALRERVAAKSEEVAHWMGEYSRARAGEHAADIRARVLELERDALRERVARVERDFARLNAEETALREKLDHECSDSAGLRIQLKDARANLDTSHFLHKIDREKLAVATHGLKDIEEQCNDSQHSATTARECLAKLGVE